MQIGPKYKIARRLGAPIFEKTQTPKYTLSQSRKERKVGMRRMKPKSEFGKALIEKQKARFTYGLTEKQFRGYVDKSLKSKEPSQKLFSLIESRLDNVLFRSGLAKTRMSARQMASHGHIKVGGKRVTIPSILLKEGDVVSLRESSVDSPLFVDVAERIKSIAQVSWLNIDPTKKEVTIKGEPVYDPKEQMFDLVKVIEFYNR